MPIYEYSCQKCGARVEVMQKITDKPLKRCKSCGGKLEKEWSPTSFQFKGSGWYVTDYAGKKTADGDKDTAKTATAAETKTDAGTDAKAAATAETKSDGGAEETKRKKTSRTPSPSKSSKSD